LRARFQRALLLLVRASCSPKQRPAEFIDIEPALKTRSLRPLGRRFLLSALCSLLAPGRSNAALSPASSPADCPREQSPPTRCGPKGCARRPPSSTRTGGRLCDVAPATLNSASAPQGDRERDRGERATESELESGERMPQEGMNSAGWPARVSGAELSLAGPKARRANKSDSPGGQLESGVNSASQRGALELGCSCGAPLLPAQQVSARGRSCAQSRGLTELGETWTPVSVSP